jgi:DNA-binding XRE family transcriptional regulator
LQFVRVRREGCGRHRVLLLVGGNTSSKRSVLPLSCTARLLAPSDNPNNSSNNRPTNSVLRCHRVVRAAQRQEAEELDTGTRLTFGDLLRRHRDSANITQEELAQRTGLTPQAISLLERGERRRPHRYTVQKLAPPFRAAVRQSAPAPSGP